MKLAEPYSIVDRIITINRELNIALKDDRFYICPVSEANDLLAEFFLTWRSSKDIKEDLLPEIDAVLSGAKPYTDIGADTMGVAYIELKVTKLLRADGNNTTMELPTEEFKEITIQWESFLKDHKR
jgi:hypothetical protein